MTLVNTATPPITTVYTSAAGTSGTGTAAGTPYIIVSLTDPATGAATNAISSSNNALVKATVYTASDAVVPNAVVTFTTDSVYGKFSGDANTALTNASGVASVTLQANNTSGGAAEVVASAKVGGVDAKGTASYAVGSSTLSLSPISLPAGTLSAYGTAGISVNVLNNGVLYTTPLTVKFTSACATAGKATLTATVTTVNGTAGASYLDNGCNNPSPGDTITATLLNGVTATAILPVGAPSLGSIQYVSTVTNPDTTPPVITLKGTGGADRSETAKVTFKVVDSAGNPVGNTLVNFALNTSVGGLTLSSTSATSDSVTGYVVTNVIAGTISTAVRVTATTGALSTQSDQLLISTGIPDQDSFSVSASAHNIEAWNYDGETSTINARLADHFSNPVPDGTAISFTSEGGQVQAGCNTVGGVCSVVLTSQALRPTNGRVTVLARATGEEAFTDKNGNGTADAGEMIDANSASTDKEEAYVDYNENGTRDANEPFFDFNSSGAYDAPDGLYNGVLCTTPGTGICAAQKSIDVRGSQVIVFSSSTATISINGNAAIALTPCNAVTGNTPTTFNVAVVDENGNAMPAGTEINFSSDNGAIQATTANPYVVPDTIGCRTNNPVTGAAYACPASAGSATFGNLQVNVISDAVFTAPNPITGDPGKCANPSKSGTFGVTVTTPKGVKSSASIGITD